MNELLIVGTGALANLFAARLSSAGVKVTMLGTWSQGLAAIQEYGVRLVTDGGEKSFPVRATADLLKIGHVRYALVLVKSWQTERAVGQLAQVLSPEGVALTLQNGLGNFDILNNKLGSERATQGVTTTGATLLSPGYVRPGGEGIITVGEHPRLDPLVDSLRKSGFAVKVVSDVETLVWRKLLINAAINPLSALLEVPNGKLLESEAARNLMSLVAREVEAVAETKGISLDFENPAAAAENVARCTANNRSSMLQDISRGAPTEIDAICGAVVQAGAELNVTTPNNHTLTLLIKAKNELSK